MFDVASVTDKVSQQKHPGIGPYLRIGRFRQRSSYCHPVTNIQFFNSFPSFCTKQAMASRCPYLSPTRKMDGKDDIEAKQLEGGKAACVVITGDECHYPELLGAYDAAADWIQKNGFETAGPPREIWYTGPGPDAKWEIVWLFK